MKLLPLAIATVAAVLSTNAMAELTGVSVSIEDYSAGWVFQKGQHTSDINRLTLNLEEKTANDLRVGINIGLISLRISENVSPSNTQKFDVSSLGLYLRLPLRLSENFSLQGRFSYRFNSGSDSIDTDSSLIEWYETRLELGFSGQWHTLRFTPFIAYQIVDGDITDSKGTELFELIDQISSGIRFDYFVDPTAYIRFQVSSGARKGFYLVFAREY